MLKDAWTLAIETLSWIELQRLGERLALNKATKKLRIKDYKAVGLAHKLVSETLRRKNLIDFLLNSVMAPKSLNDLKLGPRAFLRLYTYETKLANGNLDHSTKIARMGRSILGWWDLKDAEEVLGEILSIDHEAALKGLEETEKIGLQTYNSTWFVKYCFKLLGRAEALKFLEKSTEIPPVYVRLNTLKAPEETLLKKIEAEKTVLEKVQPLKHTYRLNETKKPLTRTNSFIHGLFYIQDKASCLAAEIADPQPGNTVLDLCAAPGAKTTYLAQLMENKGRIVSVDYSERRMGVWERETERMGVNIAESMVADARKPLPINVPSDLVILDPPCTSTGTFGKTPDAKWRLTKRSILGMAKIQSEMIDLCAEYVKEGGFLVYSTCSITLEENELVIGNFLKLHPEFKPASTKPRIGLPGLRGLTKCQRLYPHIHDCNGFFVAKLQKEKT
ncbi:MAG: RsmB/NOP family class I SAM-dependent RNA methyltransferase [Candidatus Bathyarchaeota archaeon]|nr:RsmB/NOP family class I SAM-dependent RNA methyltransferase [Candidatus Bathyarchaeum sp.]